jgi:hypothetical protein
MIKRFINMMLSLSGCFTFYRISWWCWVKSIPVCGTECSNIWNILMVCFLIAGTTMGCYFLALFAMEIFEG